MNRLEVKRGLVTVGSLLFQCASVPISSGAVKYRMACFFGLLAGLCRSWEFLPLNLLLGGVD